MGGRIPDRSTSRDSSRGLAASAMLPVLVLLALARGRQWLLRPRPSNR